MDVEANVAIERAHQHAQQGSHTQQGSGIEPYCKRYMVMPWRLITPLHYGVYENGPRRVQ